MSLPLSGLAGAVLAGGASRRMGRDKAELVVDGTTLLFRQIDVLRTGGAAPLVVSCGQVPREVPAGVVCVPDRYPNSGPLGGIHAALEALHASHVAVLAVDMPLIDAAWFGWLRGSCAPGVGAIARHADGRFEPLAAIYARESLAEMDSRLRRGDLTLQALAAALVISGQLCAVPVPDGGKTRLTNWNTPNDVNA